MQLIKIRLDELTPYEKNTKKHTPEQIEQIKDSIVAFGNSDPIGVAGDNNVIIEGNGRYLALKELGYEEAYCIRLDHLTESERKAYAIAHNKINANTGFDMELLKEEMESLLNVDFDLELTGFDDFEIEELLNANESEETKEDDYEVEIPDEPKSRQGEVYKLGKHYLMCGDSTNIEDVEKLTNGVKVDMLITDPPYNVAYEGKTQDKLTIENDNMENEQFRAFLTSAFYAADTVMKEGAAFYIWHADSEGYNFRGACNDVNWKVRQCLIWNKNSMVMGRQDYHWKHEPCLYGWKSGASHLWASDRKQTTVLEFERPSRNTEHPTMKPIALFDYQIKNNTKRNDAVLDLFAGSGTTLIACEQNGRISYNMELDPKYVDVIIERWEKFTGEKAVLLNVEAA